MRPRIIIAIFLVCFAVVLAAMGWVSANVLRLHAREQTATAQADLEERARLALWRMDSVLGTLIARENGRAYSAYTPFYPIERAYTTSLAPIVYGELLAPSPMLVEHPPFVWLYFQFEPGGAVTSPEVPSGEMRAVAESRYTSADRIATTEQRLEEFRTLNLRDTLLAALPAPTDASSTLVASGRSTPIASLSQTLEQATQQHEEQPQTGQQQFGPQQAAQQETAQQYVPRSPRQQQKRSVTERAFRSRQNSLFNDQQIAANQAVLPLPDVLGGVMTPVWLDDVLVLARRVRLGKAESIQGCQLDWPAIADNLVTRVRDLLPDAKLEPVRTSEPVEEARQLATLPVRLVPGAPPLVRDGMSPLVLSLILAWVCFSLAGIAIGVLLAGALALSERRAAFVSAVTHELRTPLTAFRLYTDLLANHVEVAPAKRTHYVDTLRHEARRLQHLVENVLAYARLERGRRVALESVRVEALLERIREPLDQRAAQAGLELHIEADEQARSVAARVDPSAVERILLNLTDNACKYARGGSQPEMNIDVTHTDNQVVVRVRDHGPGVSPNEVGRLFRPFHKSARDAAHSAAGVGLGLSLSRKLARDMGGDLTLDQTVRDGACFVLTLPIVGNACV